MKETIEHILIQDFKSIIEVEWNCPNNYLSSLRELCENLGENNLTDMSSRVSKLFASINNKFDLNKAGIKQFVDFSAQKKIYYNYHEKISIRTFFNSNDKVGFHNFIDSFLLESTLKEELYSLFKPISKAETLDFLKEKTNDLKKREQILLSLFSAYIFHSFPIDLLHNYFNGSSQIEDSYEKNYYSFLRKGYKSKFVRDHSLTVLKINQTLFSAETDYISFVKKAFSFIEKEYRRLSNHSYLSIVIEPIHIDKTNVSWRLYSDIVLFAEKFVQEKLEKGYFHPKKVLNFTKDYINELDPAKASFELANTGFTYKDCIILSEGALDTTSKPSIESSYSMVLLFEKNERDEEKIPCPSCRSLNVRGNSYPTLGVKSWECYNLFCPDKSKFNRGKRYSLASLIKQEAINDKRNYIEGDTISKYRLDVVKFEDDNSLLQFLIKHYSLYNDQIKLINFPNFKATSFEGRKVSIYSSLTEKSYSSDFFKTPFFERFVVNDTRSAAEEYKNISSIENVDIYNGDSFWVLKQFSDNSIDGAVTSPPYYNAREYTQWSNIYCYLYDMYNNAKEVFRVLKPGAPYLYNIFDYFDNENIVVFSAMGKKRMILGAYIINLFRRIGFEIVDNIIWYKGHIQGNRNNNQGNISPYYQAPLNCYEHIFYFRKPSTQTTNSKYPKILKAHPVVKMIKGENILGHTAPYPLEIPQLLTKALPKGAIILDPYAGSFSTARQAKKDGHRSINIEMNLEYCNLGMELIKKEFLGKTTTLF